MSLSENGNGNGMVMPVGPMYGNGGGMGLFGGEGGFFYLIILFLFFMFMGAGWGNNGYGNGGSAPYVLNNAANDIQRGFDQQSIMGGFNSVNSSMNTLAASLQNCCCENRLGTADLKYTIATETCADRQAVTDALNQVTMSMNSGFQGIYDKMCQLELDSYKTKVSDLQTQLNISALKESQTAQTAQVLADNAAQTAALRQAINPTPVPAYPAQYPGNWAGGCNCGQNFSGCGCN